MWRSCCSLEEVDLVDFDSRSSEDFGAEGVVEGEGFGVEGAGDSIVVRSGS